MNRHERRQRWRKGWNPERAEAGQGRANRRYAERDAQRKIADLRRIIRARERYAGEKLAREARRERQARERAK